MHSECCLLFQVHIRRVTALMRRFSRRGGVDRILSACDHQQGVKDTVSNPEREEEYRTV